MAVVLTVIFLIKNGKWLDMNPDALYTIACRVAESPQSDKDSTIEYLRLVIKEHLEDNK